jgi:chromosome segregation ATPase
MIKIFFRLFGDIQVSELKDNIERLLHENDDLKNKVKICDKNFFQILELDELQPLVEALMQQRDSLVKERDDFVVSANEAFDKLRNENQRLESDCTNLSIQCNELLSLQSSSTHGDTENNTTYGV